MEANQPGEHEKQFVALDIPDSMPVYEGSSNQLNFLPTNYDYTTTDSKPHEHGGSSQSNFNMGFIGKCVSGFLVAYV